MNVNVSSFPASSVNVIYVKRNKLYKTRMHSSWMRTARSFTVSRRIPQRGACPATPPHHAPPATYAPCHAPLPCHACPHAMHTPCKHMPSAMHAPCHTHLCVMHDPCQGFPLPYTPPTTHAPCHARPPVNRMTDRHV